ncbi:MAG: ABC-type transport auxiliary lipoprotein family protein [Aquabacterium sp.]|nr:ABC-type transport auxiliary lipoprotein family protein [Aquabacterium sp.]
MTVLLTRHRLFSTGLRRSLAVLLALQLAGCGASLLPKPPAAPVRYTLDDAAPRPAARAPADDAPVLVVAVPRAAPGHDSVQMVYLRQPQELASFAYNEWVDTPAHMLAPLLVRALQDSGAFRAVLLAPSAAHGDLRLETELIRLQQDFSERPSQLRLTLRAVLLDSATRRVIASREFDQSVPAPSDDPAGGAAAAHVATQRLLAALARFCAEPVRR